MLWNTLKQAMIVAAGAGVLSACCASAVWGQAENDLRMRQGSRSQDATVTVANLQIPAAAWRHYERAKRAQERHRDAEFDRETAKALEIAPGFASMYLLRATVEVSARHFEAAIASVQSATKADSGAMWAAVVLAGAYNGMHRFHDAILALNAAQGAEAESWQSMYERARAETGLQDRAAAMLWSGKVLGVAPSAFIDAHLVRANALMIDQHLPEAITQMTVYLHSSGPQVHRAEVLAAIDALRARIAYLERGNAAIELANTPFQTKDTSARLGKTSATQLAWK